jgi:hypothetical protein
MPILPDPDSCQPEQQACKARTKDQSNPHFADIPDDQKAFLTWLKAGEFDVWQIARHRSPCAWSLERMISFNISLKRDLMTELIALAYETQRNDFLQFHRFASEAKMAQYMGRCLHQDQCFGWHTTLDKKKVSRFSR